MSNWKNYKLAEITEIRGGKRLPKGHDYSCDVTEFPYLRVVDFSKKTINKNTIKYLSTDTAQKISRYIINKEDVYISIAGTIGLVGTIPDDLDGAYLTENAAKLVIRDNKLVHKDYLVEYLSSNEGRQQIKKQTISTSQPKLSLFRMGEIMIPIPCIEVQLKIVKILKCVQQLIDKRKEQIQALDELVKSQFIEMFGEEKNKKPIGALCTIKARIGWQGLTKKEYLNEGEYRLVTGVDFKNGRIDFDRCFFVTKQRYEQDDNIKLKVGDVLVTKDGTIGKVAIVDKIEMPTTLNSGVFVVRDTTGSLNNIFLVNALLSYDFKRFVDNIKVGATIAHLNQGTFVKYKIPVPPIELQNQFADFVKQTDRLKLKMEKSLKELEDNFNSLMQRAFNGELFSE